MIQENPSFSLGFDILKSVGRSVKDKVAYPAGRLAFRSIRYVADRTSFIEPVIFAGVYAASRVYGASLEAHFLINGIDLALAAKWGLAKIAPLPLVGIYGHIEGSWSEWFGKKLGKAARKAERFYRTPGSETLRTARQMKRVARRLYEDLHNVDINLPRSEYKNMDWCYDESIRGNRRIRIQ